MLEALSARREDRGVTGPTSFPAQRGETAPLVQLLRAAAVTGYRFITPTPLTHQRVLDRRGSVVGTTLRDIFRPDTYRFARFILQALQTGDQRVRGLEKAAAGGGRPLRVLDVGCGSGAGAMVAARAMAAAGCGAAVEITLNDMNPLALHYAGANAACGRLPVKLAEGDALSAVKGQFDLIISNPPYLDDAAQRAYRHGGARLGRALSVRIAQEALGRLARGGQLFLYTGVAIVDGRMPFAKKCSRC